MSRQNGGSERGEGDPFRSSLMPDAEIIWSIFVVLICIISKWCERQRWECRGTVEAFVALDNLLVTQQTRATRVAAAFVVNDNKNAPVVVALLYILGDINN